MPTILIQKAIPQKLLDAVAVAAADGISFALPAIATLVQWESYFDAAPDAVSIAIQTSIDGTNWFNAATSTATAGETGNFNTAASFIRGIIVSATAGAATACTIQIVAKQVN